MNSRMLPEADEELEVETERYERASPGTGRRFFRHVRDILDRLTDQPRLYGYVDPPVHGREIREAWLRPFDFRLVYEVRADAILVIAVAHNRRLPNYWRGRLRGT
jgi:plasmid stabilization system protein ParE